MIRTIDTKMTEPGKMTPMEYVCDWNEQSVNLKKMIEAIINSSRAYIVFITPDYRVMFYNKKAWQSSKILFGLELKVGLNFEEYLSKVESAITRTFKENFMKVILDGNSIVSEREMVFNDVTVWIRVEYTPVYDENTLIGVSLRVVDITERKSRELQIERQNEILSEIAWIQSHVTRQPIATALGLLHILEKSEMTSENRRIISMLEETIQKVDLVVRGTVTKTTFCSQSKAITTKLKS